MLDLMCGQRPADQRPILDSTAYIEATAHMQRLPAHLQYLADQLTSPVPYADKVQVTLRQTIYVVACNVVGISVLNVLLQVPIQHLVGLMKCTIM